MPESQVNESQLAVALAKAGRTSEALTEILRLRDDEESWLALAIRLRNYGTHRGHVARLYHVGGERSGQVYYHDPRTGRPIEMDIPEFLRTTIEEMRRVIDYLRGTLPT